MNHDTLTQLLNQYQQSTPNLPTIPPSIWLIGTSHCHLCELAEAQLKQCQKVIAFAYQPVDIVDLLSQLTNPDNNPNNKHDQQTQLEQLAQAIPVVVSESGMLSYPFGILDIQKLLEQSNQQPSNP